MNIANLPLHHYTLSVHETLAFRLHGHGALKVVLVHGLAARSETWSDLVELFPPERYSVYLLDLLGSGESAKPKGGEYSIRAHSRRLIAFLKGQRLEKAILIGHSLGGAVVLLAAVDAMVAGEGSLLGAIVIVAGPGYLQRLPLMAEIFRNRLAAALFIALYAPDLWVKLGLEMAYFDHRLVDREHVARYAPCYRERSAKRALVATCRGLIPIDQEEIISRYQDLRLPVLLLWGRHDRIVPLSQGTRLEAAIRGAELKILEGCGHNPHEEKPAETFDAIDRFITRPPGAKQRSMQSID